MMDDELLKAREPAAIEDGTEEDALIRREIEAAFAAVGGVSSEELQAGADEIAKGCAECGITAAELHGILAYPWPSLEDALRELMEKAGVNAKASRGPTGFEGKRPPMDTRPHYTAPESTAGRKKKHGRERGRKL